MIKRKIERGDIYFVDFGIGYGSEQRGYRPVLVIQNDVGNTYSKTVIVASITTKTKKMNKTPTHCYIGRNGGLFKNSIVLLEQLSTVDKFRLERYVGHLSNNSINRINKALAVSVGLKHKLI